jgi:hypothetical protein
LGLTKRLAFLGFTASDVSGAAEDVKKLPQMSMSAINKALVTVKLALGDAKQYISNFLSTDTNGKSNGNRSFTDGAANKGVPTVE